MLHASARRDMGCIPCQTRESTPDAACRLDVVDASVVTGASLRLGQSPIPALYGGRDFCVLAESGWATFGFQDPAAA